MIFNLEGFRSQQVPYPRVFSFRNSMSKQRYEGLYERFKDAVDKDAAFERIKERTSGEYFNDVYLAQTSALSYAEHMFPAYQFLLPDVLMDDWLSVICPHNDGKRDHSLHQPLTAYIVAGILGVVKSEEQLMIKGQSLLSSCADVFLGKDKTAYLWNYLKGLYPKELPTMPERSLHIWGESVFTQAALMAAMFHDIGYPWQFMNMLGKGPSQMDMLSSEGYSVKTLYEQICHRLLVYPFYGYSSSSLNHPIVTSRQELYQKLSSAIHHTHGFPGALVFTYLNDILHRFPADLNFEAATSRFIQDWAAVAILMHDMVWQYRDGDKVKNPCYRLHADTDPLSCLIAMADVLEEFGRPKAKFNSFPDKAEIQYLYPCVGTELEVTGSTLKITYIYRDHSALSQNKAKREKEIDVYFNPEDGYIDLRAIGIEHVECLCKVTE